MIILARRVATKGAPQGRQLKGIMGEVERALNTWRDGQQRRRVVGQLWIRARARGVKELEITIPCALVAIHLAVRQNAVAVALSHFELHLSGRGPHPERQLSGRGFRKLVEAKCGQMHVDMVPGAARLGHLARVRPKAVCRMVSFGGSRSEILCPVRRPFSSRTPRDG